MAKLQQRTLKFYANIDFEKAEEEFYRMCERDFPDYIMLPFWYNSFREEPGSYGCDKLIVFAYYAHNDRSPATKEVYALLYKPKN